MIRPKLRSASLPVLKKVDPFRKLILVTAHRRESFGKPLVEVCKALKDLVKKHPDIEIIYPVHLNPNVQQTVRKALQGTPRVHLIEPLDYVEFLVLMDRAYLILTDSGGVQEEAPSFQKPVLVMREVSERMEGVKAGLARLVGTDRMKIVREASRLIASRTAYRAMTGGKNPYGDGRASERIVKFAASDLTISLRKPSQKSLFIK